MNWLSCTLGSLWYEVTYMHFYTAYIPASQYNSQHKKLHSIWYVTDVEPILLGWMWAILWAYQNGPTNKEWLCCVMRQNGIPVKPDRTPPLAFPWALSAEPEPEPGPWAWAWAWARASAKPWQPCSQGCIHPCTRWPGPEYWCAHCCLCGPLQGKLSNWCAVLREIGV